MREGDETHPPATGQPQVPSPRPPSSSHTHRRNLSAPAILCFFAESGGDERAGARGEREQGGREESP